MARLEATTTIELLEVRRHRVPAQQQIDVVLHEALARDVAGALDEITLDRLVVVRARPPPEGHVGVAERAAALGQDLVFLGRAVVLRREARRPHQIAVLLAHDEPNP
jgi:hypothetical protein